MAAQPIKSHFWYRAKTHIGQIRHHLGKYCNIFHVIGKKTAEEGDVTFKIGFAESSFCTLYENNSSCWQHQLWRLPACFHNRVLLFEFFYTPNLDIEYWLTAPEAETAILC